MAVISVSQVNKIIKEDIENDVVLKRLQVSGEISNLKIHNTGHFYFSMKDDEGKINCVMFQTYASKVNFKLEDGMKVIVTCSVGVYVTAGSYQLYVYNIEPLGVGTLFLKFEELKKKLFEEGLFDENHKKPLPKYPLNIAVISAKEGAAIQDVIRTINRRWPVAQITLIPSLVQGEYAPKSIVDNLKLADTLGFDLILLTRGGGSIEDLWCFNDEDVARTIYSLNTPIISAVGHEVDFTIADYVADLRAPTPTGGGEISTPERIDVLTYLANLKQRLVLANKNQIVYFKQIVKQLSQSSYLTKIESLFADKQAHLSLLEQKLLSSKNILLNNSLHKLDKYKNDLINGFKNNYHNNLNKTKNIESKLDSLSPLKIMSRGYGIISKDNDVITSIDKLKIDDDININLKDGTIKANIKDIKRR